MIITSNHPLMLLCQEFAELCKPLQIIGVEHLTYLRQLNDGTRVCLSNKPQWVDDYYNLGLYQSSLFESPEEPCEPEYQLWLGDYDLDVYYHGRDNYKTSDAISVKQACEGGCEYFLFSAHVDNQLLMPYLANNMDILYHFILFLKDKGRDIFKKSEKCGIQVQLPFANHAIADASLNENYFVEMHLLKNKFYDKTPITKISLQDGSNKIIKLSRQEIACISNLIEHPTSKALSSKVGVTSRTIESYLENIKTKLNCSSKEELIKLIKANRRLSALTRG